MRNVPVSGAVITDEDIKAVIESVKKGWFTEGVCASEFAHQLKKYIGTRHAVLCNSGSSANLLAMTALVNEYRKNLGPTYVVTCATGFPTTIAPIVQNRCIPLFIDANPNTLNPDTNTVLEALQCGDVIGVALAHTLGFPYDAKKIKEECDKLDKFLLEDCADALGTEIYGQKVGSFGHVSTFSFFPAHHITSVDYKEPVIVLNKEKNRIDIVSIGKFVDHFPYEKYQCLSFDKNGIYEFRDITNIVRHPVDEDLYKITVQTGRNVVVSESHSIFGRQDNKIIPIEVSSLSIGDYVFVPNNLPNLETKREVWYVDYRKGSWKSYDKRLELTSDLGKLLGYFVAEGSYNHTKSGNYGLVFTFSSNEREYADFVVSALYKIFSISAKIYRKGNSLDVKCSHKGVYKFFELICGKGASNKKVPWFIFSSPSDVKLAFINAYYDGDGCEHKTYGKHKGFSMDSVTVSKELSVGLHFLLLQLGINSRYSIKSEEGTRNFGGYISETKRAYAVCYSNKSILDADGFRGEKKHKTRKIGNLSLAKITKIEKVQPTSKYVYDLSVDGHENFVGGIGFALHNTGEGGAVLTNNGKLLKQINSLNSWGRDCWCSPGNDNTCNKRFEHKWNRLPEGWDHKYTFTNLGYNLKMTEMQAALGLSQLQRIEDISQARNDNYVLLYGELRTFEVWLDFPWVDDPNNLHPISPFGLPISVISDKFTKQELVSYLEEHGVRTRPVFTGNITRHPMADQFYYEQIGDLSGSDFIMENTFWIGCQEALTKDDLDYVVETFYGFFKEKGLI